MFECTHERFEYKSRNTQMTFIKFAESFFAIDLQHEAAFRETRIERHLTVLNHDQDSLFHQVIWPSRASRSGDWMLAPSVAVLGLHLSDEEVWITVGVTLHTTLCELHLSHHCSETLKQEKYRVWFAQEMAGNKCGTVCYTTSSGERCTKLRNITITESSWDGTSDNILMTMTAMQHSV